MTTLTANHAFAAALKARALHQPPASIINADKDAGSLNKEKLARWSKAITDPMSTTNTAGIQEVWASFEALLRDQAILPQLPAAVRVDLDQTRETVNIPVGAGRGQLKGHWVAEGAAIPVASGELVSKQLAPRQMKIISVFSRELLTRSIPEIAAIVQDQLVMDTVEALDASLFDDEARTAVRPAGLANVAEVGSGNAVAATAIIDTSDTDELLKKITGDLRGMLSRAKAARAHQAGAWLADPDLIAFLSDLRDVNGNLAFPSLTSTGLLKGHRIIASANAPASKLVYVSDRALAIGSGTPKIDMSESAVLHMTDAPDTDISGSAPLRSTFQTETIALKMTLSADWRCIREGGIQSLSGVNGWLA